MTMDNSQPPKRVSPPEPSRPQRILLVVDGGFPALGGAERQVALLARSFQARGHQVTVLAPALPGYPALAEQVDGISVVRLRYPHVRHWGALVLCMRFGRWLLAHRNDYDAVHVHMVHTLAAVAGLVRPILGLPVAVKISGAWEFEGGLLDPKLRKKPFYRLLNWGVRRVDIVQCISDYTREMVQQAGYAAGQLRMIPNAVDTDRFVPAVAHHEPPRVAYVGRLRTVKGVYVLIEAWAAVVREQPAVLLVAGDGPEFDGLRARVKALGLSDSVEFLGAVSDVPAVLKQACIYAQPSYQEGMPNSVLEAMAAGLPIVATRISGNVDLVTDQYNGLLVEAGDAQAFAEATLALLRDRTLAQRMGQRSRERVVAQYGVDAVLSQLLTSYAQCRHQTQGVR